MNLLFALLLSSQIASPAGDLLLSVGDDAPPFSMRDLDRKMFSIRTHLGEGAEEPRKAIVMVFFATWCKPCMKEIPILKKINKRWAKKGVEVVYVGLSQGKKDLAPFAKANKLPWRVVPDSFGLLGRRYGAASLPHLFILDKDGRIAFQHRGIAPKFRQMLDDQLVRITGEAAPVEGGAEDLVATKPRFDTSMNIGRAPFGTGSVARWEPLSLFVGEALDTNLSVTTESSYEEYEKALLAGKYEFANAGPLLCNKVKDLYEPVVRLERQGTPTYFGILFTLRNKAIRNITDLKGKKIGLVSEYSTSGGLFPQLALIDAGINPRKDLEIVWLGSHTKVAEAVRDGKVDAGGCYEDCRDSIWSGTRDKAVHSRILSYTREIPSEMILVRKDLAPKVKAKFLKALLALNNQQSILAQISQGETPVSGFAKASDKDLDGVRDAIRAIEKSKK